jgi:hypothetical protein
MYCKECGAEIKGGVIVKMWYCYESPKNKEKTPK